ncbi:1-phosphatidylinositol 4-5-bisphosphate phosphodiesterase classes I and II, partial [Plutella xylostella]
MVSQDMRVRHVVSMGPAGALEDKTVTVCHGMDFVNVCFINFCCAKKEIAQLWTRELFALAYNLNQLTASALGALEKLHARIALRRDKQGYIQVKNIVRLFASSKEDRRRVEAALGAGGLPCGKDDRLHVDKFTFEDFFTFYKCLTQRDEVTQLFNQISGGKPVLSAAALAGFLNGVQRDPRLNEILHPYADRARAAELLRTHERNPCHVSRDQMTPDGFLRFLLSADSGAVAAHRVEALDLDQPLAHYYINSSHNTYLTGHQITGKSSVEIYRQTLLAGCRCVELDFWNGRTEEPVIVHGYTFVPEVPARDVLEAIAEAAFKTSDCPVILSFENHCNPRQQAKIATYCREIFGDMLLDRALDSHPLVP